MTKVNITNQKKRLRKYFIDIRKQISPLDQQNASLQIAKQFCALPQYKTRKNIAVYFPHKNEISTIPIINALLKDHKNCYLPKIDFTKKCSLAFVKYDLNTELVPNKFNILEPKGIASSAQISSATAAIATTVTTIAPYEFDIIIVPCVAFDSMLYRLGLGGGYYDKIIKQIRARDSDRYSDGDRVRTQIIGVAFAAQEIDQIPLEEWDMSLDIIITEQAIASNHSQMSHSQ